MSQTLWVLWVSGVIVLWHILKTSRPQDFTGSLSMIYPHELFSVIYTHYRSFFFKYIAPATEIIDKFWEQVAGVINFVFLGFLSPYDSYESQVSFWVWGPHKLLMESHPPQMCFLMLLKKLCEGSPQFQSNPTLAGRVLSKMLPLTIHGDGTPVCGAGKSWSKMGDFFSWSCMLMTSGHSQLTRFLIFMVHAYMRCPNLMS